MAIPPWMMPTFAALIAITCIPEIMLWLPRLLEGE
jgi:TRAP-type C4-dicarboxylate transport system permease large subunit